jgi:hypothetical protein
LDFDMQNRIVRIDQTHSRAICTEVMPIPIMIVASGGPRPPSPREQCGHLEKGIERLLDRRSAQPCHIRNIANAALLTINVPDAAKAALKASVSNCSD